MIIFPLRHRFVFARQSAALAACMLVLLAGCGKPAAPPSPGPVEVTVLKTEPRDTPIMFEYVAQTQSPQQVSIVARLNFFFFNKCFYSCYF